ncbi:uncharacterized protein LOC132384026 [Hypanus sabinus]|uniref:uncharacterized protein LOC132384026 n=1 Tax=Hypanus sabinus TaxID=79690 RepID=UPI0028C43105|nr:uncharacterized protein LOC132384026 [Hypanus sabinus]XP_059811287.1 uncharacterized protein LOC132384026 [Hypanus sabinus]
MISESIGSLNICEGFQDTPSEPPACLLHHGLVQAGHAGCLLNGRPCSRPLPAPHSQMAGDYPAPDIVAIEHNYCSRRASKNAGPAGAWGGGTAGVGQARRALNAQRWSCGAAALRSTRQGSRARAQARIEVDEAVDLVVGVHQVAGRREAADEAAEAPPSPQQWEEKEVPAWSSSGPSIEQADGPDRSASEPGEAGDPPLKIHRLTPEEYKAVFSTVVGKALTNTASRPTRKCSLDLARRIKEHLYNAVNRPTFREIVHTDGRVEFVEHYNLSSRKRSPPHFELDTTGEPDSEDKASEWAELAGKNS